MFLGSNIDNSKITFMLENKRAKPRSEVKLLGITIGDKLSFTTHIENLCSTPTNRLRASARTIKFISFEQAKHLSEAYIMSTFRYVLNPQTILLTKSINAALVLYIIALN